MKIIYEKDVVTKFQRIKNDLVYDYGEKRALEIINEIILQVEKMVELAKEINDDFAVKDDNSLLEKLDRGIDDMEAGHLTPHDEAMKIITKRFEEYVLQHS